MAARSGRACRSGWGACGLARRRLPIGPRPDGCRRRHHLRHRPSRRPADGSVPGPGLAPAAAIRWLPRAIGSRHRRPALPGSRFPGASLISSSLSSSHCSSVRWLSGIDSSSCSRRRGETGLRARSSAHYPMFAGNRAAADPAGCPRLGPATPIDSRSTRATIADGAGPIANSLQASAIGPRTASRVRVHWIAVESTIRRRPE